MLGTTNEGMINNVSVLTANENLCRGTKHLKVQKTSGYMASQVALETSCGTHKSPWYIEGQPGQVVNVTLYDFTEKDNEASESVTCVR